MEQHQYDPHDHGLEILLRYHPFDLLNKKNLARLNQYQVDHRQEIELHNQQLIIFLHIQKQSCFDRFRPSRLERQCAKFS